MKYLKLLFLGLLFTGCASFHLSTLNHDPIYDTVLIVPADVQVDTLTVSQLRWKLRTDFQFRYDFAQYALSQPRSFDWNNRVLGNRYSFFNQYSFGYNTYMSRDMMWNDWVWGYNSYSPHMWSPFRYDRWGYNSYGWNNYGWNWYNNWHYGSWYNRGHNIPGYKNRGRNSSQINGRRNKTQTPRRVVTTTTRPKNTTIRYKPRTRINTSRTRTNTISRPPRTIRISPRTSTRSNNNNTVRSNSRKKN